MKYILTLFLAILTLPQMNLNAQYCVTGCNDNAFLTATDPNTMEYDNIVGLYHSSMLKESNGRLLVWGASAAANGSDQLTPLAVTPANGYNYSGNLLKFTGGAGNSTKAQFAILTTDGLYFWGTSTYLVSANVKSGNGFSKANDLQTEGVTGTSSYSLPMGVNPTDVKMMFGTDSTLSIVTCTGAAYVLTQKGTLYGDGTPSTTTSDKWHRVSTASGTPLTNVVAVRGTTTALLALTSNGNIYTWGVNAFLGNSTAASNLSYATLMTKPSGTIKQIGMTGGNSYYVLNSAGELYSLGNNLSRELGVFSTINQNSWVRVLQNTTGTPLPAIAWISPNEHTSATNSRTSGYATINALTTTGQLWSWGNNAGNMLGSGSTPKDPTLMIGGLDSNDRIMAVATGGHTTMVIKQCSMKYGYLGHKTNGSMGDGTAVNGYETTFNFTNTADVSLCGAPAAPAVQNLSISTTTANLANGVTSTTPSNSVLQFWTTPNRAPGTQVTNPTSAAPGTYYAFYIPSVGNCAAPLASAPFTVSLDPCRYGASTNGLPTPRDSDGDGINDSCDLDSDNDGILDADEMFCDQTIAPNGTFPVANNPATTPSYINQLLFFDWSGVTLSTANPTATRSVIHNGITYTATVSGYSGPGTMTGTDILTYGGPTQMTGRYYNVNGDTFKEVLYSNFTTGTNSFNVTLSATRNGVSYPVNVVVFDPETTNNTSGNTENLIYTTSGNNFTLLEKTGSATSVIGSNITGDGTKTITYLNTQSSSGSGLPPVNALYQTAGKGVTINASMLGANSRQGLGFAIRLYCDTDNDGNPNFLDVDSDGDGCADAIEGSELVTLDQIYPLNLPSTDANFALRGQIKVIYNGTTINTPSNIVSQSASALGVPQLVNNAANNYHAITNPTNLAGVADNSDGTSDVGQDIGISTDAIKSACFIDAVNDINQIPQGLTVFGNLMTNDRSYSSPITVQSATYLNSAGAITPLTIGTATDVYNSSGVLAGSITLNSNGSYSFVPTPTFVGIVPINYIAVNTVGSTDPAELTIEVIKNPDATNSNPVAQNDTGYTIIGVPFSSNVLVNDSDPNGNPLYLTSGNQGGVNIPNGSPVVVSGIDQYGNPVANAGTITGSVNGNYTFIPSSGFIGTINPISYTVIDGQGGSATAELNIKVLPNFGNTTFANDDAKVGIQGATLTGNVLTNDTDPQGNSRTVTSATAGGTTLTIGVTTTIPGVGTLRLNASGTFTFVPLASYVGTTNVIYTMCDNGSPQACDTATLYLTELPLGVCYNNPNTTGTAVPSNHGITLLQRGGAENGNWPMIRSSAHTVLESNTKGFVITRMTPAQINALTGQEGMMVYDTENKCLKIYSDGVWSCFENATCP